MEDDNTHPTDPNRDKNGRYKKGHGVTKVKGSTSVKRQVWEEVSDYFVNEGLDAYTANLDEMLNSANPIKKAEGMKHYQALLEYFKPKLSRTDSHVEHKGAVPITINKNYNKD